MAKRIETAAKKKAIVQYDLKDKKRANNPPIGLVDAKSDAAAKKSWTAGGLRV